VELSDGKAYLEFLENLVVLLRTNGIGEYVTPGLQLKFTPGLVIGGEEPSITEKQKPGQIGAGFSHPSLWPDGKAPTFPK